jgi:SAM-dependent methyltransferase
MSRSNLQRMRMSIAPDPSDQGLLGLMRCMDCGTALRGREVCPGCQREYPERQGIREAMGVLEGRNRIAAAFYDGPGWRRFRPWERLFLAVQGGQRRARMQILRHLRECDSAHVLEVGIGDGENLRLFPTERRVVGVDIARGRLAECLRRCPSMAGRLVLAEAEHLPFEDASFDIALTIGGFNFFGDHHATLREMRRVTRPGGIVLVADEVPWLQRMGIGHLIGAPSLDAYWLRALGLDRDFADVVMANRLDLDATFGADLPGATRFSIWAGLGYCVVHHRDTNDGKGQEESSNVDDH